MKSVRAGTTQHQLLHRLLRFSLLPVISAIIPIVALPILARSVSVTEWAAIAIGQSIGGVAAITISNGWNILGPLATARAEGDRHLILQTAMVARLSVTVFVLPISVGLALLLPTNGEGLLVAAMTASTAIAGLGIAWFAIGAARPGLLASAEVGPRVVANVAGATLAAILDNALVYPLFLGAVQIIVVLFFWRREVGGGWTNLRGRQPVAVIRRHLTSTGTEMVAGLYSLGAAAIVAITGTLLTVANFNSAYRLVTFGAIGIAALSNGLMGWIAESSGETYLSRIRWSLGLHGTLGVLGLLGFASFGPWVSELIFGSELAVSRQLAIPMGFFFLLWSIETVTSRHILAARGRTRAMLFSTCVGSVFGVGALLVAGPHGPVAAAWALVAAIGLIVTQQVAVATTVLRSQAGASGQPLDRSTHRPV